MFKALDRDCTFGLFPSKQAWPASSRSVSFAAFVTSNGGRRALVLRLVRRRFTTLKPNVSKTVFWVVFPFIARVSLQKVWRSIDFDYHTQPLPLKLLTNELNIDRRVAVWCVSSSSIFLRFVFAFFPFFFLINPFFGIFRWLSQTIAIKPDYCVIWIL